MCKTTYAMNCINCIAFILNLVIPLVIPFVCLFGFFSKLDCRIEEFSQEAAEHTTDYTSVKRSLFQMFLIFFRLNVATTIMVRSQQRYEKVAQ